MRLFYFLQALLFALILATTPRPGHSVPWQSSGAAISIPPVLTCPSDDGSSGAPVATIQNPTLLNSYASANTIRNLGCKVAGVDYAVGIPSATVLTDWQALAGTPGIDISGTTVRCQGTFAANPSADATITAVDFSLHGGAHVYIPSGGCSSLIITNSRFGCSTVTGSDLYYIQSQNNAAISVKYSEVNGQGCEIGQNSFLSTSGDGTITLEYDYFNNLIDHLLEQGASTGNNTIVYKYNFINGFNPSLNAANHMNFLQLGSGTVSPFVEFNTVSIPRLFATAPGEVFQYYFNGSGTITNPVNSYNTIIGLLPSGQTLPSISYAIHGGSAGGTGTTVLSGTGTNTGNYYDISGMYDAYYPSSMAGWTSNGNINMKTGGTIVPSAPACPDDDGSASAPVASIQNPTLISGGSYVRTLKGDTGCKLPGVDYAVGIPTAKQSTLRDWQTISCSGCTVNSNNVRIDGAGPTLDNYDFSLHGGAYIYISSSASGTVSVTNSNFACSTLNTTYSIQSQAPTLNLTVKNNKFDGTNCGTNQSAFVGFQSSGTFIFQYNWFFHGQQQALNLNGLDTSYMQTLDYRFNYSEDMAIQTVGNHLNLLQLQKGTITITTEHNTHYQHTLRSDLAAGEGYQIENANGVLGTTISNSVLRYNTLIAVFDPAHPSNVTMSNMMHGLCHSGSQPDCNNSLTVVSGTCNIDHNYGDVTAAFNFFYPSGGTPMWTNCTLASNVNMSSGALFPTNP